MSALFPVALSAPARRVGSVDATRDRKTPTARSLDEAFGPGARSSVVIPMNDETPIHPADRLVLRACAAAGVLLVLILLAERFL